MDHNKLFIFSKNTDAVDSQRGYSYQTLKTLETWITNFLDNNREEIYCEFEEDIFQKDTINEKLKFRQIKLYSQNFSFSSEEIKKGISHFFMLHVKSDYNDFSKEYVFETNTNIAGKYKNNDALLLKDWFDNQNKLDDQKIVKYAEKVKQIVSEYIAEQKTVLKDEKGADEAFEIFKNLEDSFWSEFAKTIKWKFIGTTPEEEFALTRKNIENKIQLLPYKFVENIPAQIFGVLLDNVFTTVTHKDSEQRKLTYELFEKALLEIGSDDDQWYSRRFEYYKTIDCINEFRIGEFLEILDLVNYCRRKKYLQKHKDKWNPFLIFYARNTEISEVFRKKAIYEIIFLNNEVSEVDYNNLSNRNRPQGNLHGFEEDIRFYFSDFDSFEKAVDLEDAHILITLLFPAIMGEKVNISLEELRIWNLNIYRKINRKLSIVTDINEKCHLLEQKGSFLMGANLLRRKDSTDFICFYDELLKLVDRALLFKLSQFGDRIEKYIKIYLTIDPLDKKGVIRLLEDFSEKLFPLVEKREGKIKLAQSQVQRGFSYLNTKEPKNILKALEYFHKAKDNYLQEDTIEGFILALLNIAQLYIAIGMHFAAKNYALAAFLMSSNKHLIKRTEDSLAMLVLSDFKQGSWFNSLIVSAKYINLRLEGNFDPTEIEKEMDVFTKVALIIHFMNKDSNQFKYFSDSYLRNIDYIGEEIIKPLQAKVNEEMQDDETYKRLIESKIDDFPLNDIGKERVIRFYALGSLWIIKFQNDYKSTSVSEEFISSIQIALAEIALSEVDFHLIKSTIEIELYISDQQLAPKLVPDNDSINWRIPVNYSNAKGNDNINKHSAFNLMSLNVILNNISLLKSEEFQELFETFFKQRDLDVKQTALNLYQKTHRYIYTEEDFNAFQATMFQKEEFNLKLPRENIIMVWDDSVSLKYDKAFSLESIKNRFNNIQKCTYITLAKLKENPEFRVWIKNLREQGWKDWQIMLNIHNYMINYKIRWFENKDFDTEQEYVDHLTEMTKEYLDKDEKDCYVEFPLEAFKEKEFMHYFDTMFPSILITLGLETKSITPNLSAIKEFLNVRFNMAEDDYDENNPLIDIV